MPQVTDEIRTAMKHAVAALYANFEAEIEDAEGIEQAEDSLQGPLVTNLC